MKRFIIQGVPKLVIQKSAVIISEIVVRIWSGEFQYLRLVLKFSFRPSDGIPFVQSSIGGWLLGLGVVER
jgi:hypothetical protein